MMNRLFWIACLASSAASGCVASNPSADETGAGGAPNEETAASPASDSAPLTTDSTGRSLASGGSASFSATSAWIGIVGTGQSLSIGVRGDPALNTRQRYNNLKLLDSGSVPRYDGVGDRLSMVPLTEPIRPVEWGTADGYVDQVYPANIQGETPHTIMGDQITAWSRRARSADYITVHSVVGEGGRSISAIKKGGTGGAYSATLYEARAIKALAAAARKSFSYGAVVLTHGEADASLDDYEDQIYRLYLDYNADLKAITGQRSDIPMLLSQQATKPKGPITSPKYPKSAQAQWKAGVDYPGKIICVGPKYQYAYTSDHVHLDAYGYQRLGIKYAEVYYRKVILGEDWKPLQPTRARRSGRVITVDFHVPNGPLAWEESLLPPHQAQLTEWKDGRGFEVESSAGRQRISSVAIRGSSVEITLAAAPTGRNLRVRYAMSQDAVGYAGGLQTGRRGQLRDSNPFVGEDRQSISVRVTRGSTRLAVPAGTFARRGVRDRVQGSGLPDGTVVLELGDDFASLSRPWSGASGTASLTFFSDQRNYAVQFDLPVP